MTLAIQPRAWAPSNVAKPVIKPVIKALDWTELIRGAIPKAAKDSRKVLKRVSDGLGVFDLAWKREKLLHSFNLALSGTTLSEKAVGSIDTLSYATSIAGTGVAAVETMQDLGAVTLTVNQLLILNIFGFICSCILVIKSILDIQKTYTILNKLDVWSPEFNSRVLSIAKKICQFICGIFAMAFFFYGAAVVSPYLILGVSTVSLSISIAKDIYDYNKVTI